MLGLPGRGKAGWQFSGVGIVVTGWVGNGEAEVGLEASCKHKIAASIPPSRLLDQKKGSHPASIAVRWSEQM